MNRILAYLLCQVFGEELVRPEAAARAVRAQITYLTCDDTARKGSRRNAPGRAPGREPPFDPGELSGVSRAAWDVVADSYPRRTR